MVVPCAETMELIEDIAEISAFEKLHEKEICGICEPFETLPLPRPCKVVIRGVCRTLCRLIQRIQSKITKTPTTRGGGGGRPPPPPPRPGAGRRGGLGGL